MAADAHVRKRQYQPSITSFLSSNGDRVQQIRSPLSPPLPAETQASLLSVGMRIRKSVPEGYKTHKTIGTTGFPFPSTPPPRVTAPVRTTYNQQPSRELMPFCGLHKVGGLAVQPEAWVLPSSAPANMETDEDDEDGDLPDLSMSQGTLPSTQGSFGGSLDTRNGGAGQSRKRGYEDDVEDDMDAIFDELDAEDGAISTRAVARPKVSLRRAATNSAALGGTNNDFEEAAFLAPMDVDEAP